VKDVTFFASDSVEALAALQAYEEKSSEEKLEALFNYHVVQNFAGYSTNLENGMRLQSIEGANLTITKQGADTFVKGAKIVSSGFLVANGVFHFIDR
jgi:uncharacterized surface protein with fasciclin (FAS1) repeats